MTELVGVGRWLGVGLGSELAFGVGGICMGGICICICICASRPGAAKRAAPTPRPRWRNVRRLFMATPMLSVVGWFRGEDTILPRSQQRGGGLDAQRSEERRGATTGSQWVISRGERCGGQCVQLGYRLEERALHQQGFGLVVSQQIDGAEDVSSGRAGLNGWSLRRLHFMATVGGDVGKAVLDTLRAANRRACLRDEQYQQQGGQNDLAVGPHDLFSIRRCGLASPACHMY